MGYRLGLWWGTSLDWEDGKLHQDYHKRLLDIRYTFFSELIMHTWTLQILGKYGNFRNVTYINRFYPKHLDLRFEDFDCMFLGLVKQRPKKCVQPLKRPGGNPAKPAKKKTQKPANPWNLVILDSFRIFFQLEKIFTVCVRGRSAEIFQETYIHVWNKFNIFFGALTYILGSTIFFLGTGGSRYCILLNPILIMANITRKQRLFHVQSIHHVQFRHHWPHPARHQWPTPGHFAVKTSWGNWTPPAR